MKKESFPSPAFFLCALTVMILVCPLPAHAFKTSGSSETNCSDCHTMEIRETEAILKDLVNEVHGVGFSEIPGFYIVDATGKNGKRGLLYLDFSKKYVIAGNFVSIAEKLNISQREMARLRRVDPTTIPLTDSLVIGDPGASKKLILFTDPQCPYCEKLHPELKKVVKTDPDIVFFIKMMPLVSIHPDSHRIARSILCEGSVKLLEDSFAGKKIPDPSCQSDAVDRTIELAQELGISSTPTLIFPDGRLVSGYRSAENIINLLNNK